MNKKTHKIAYKITKDLSMIRKRKIGRAHV